MRILSVIIRNYRVHRELKVDFDRARTLISGPNETGKSTAIEAIHRALFLKAKGNTENHRAMISTTSAGHPEVELAFEVGDQVYQLRKRFGQTGTTSLVRPATPPLSADEAEAELARLLGVEPGLAGKAVLDQWAHLWVSQGQSGRDPSVQATANQDRLLQRLQQMGAAGALQSELDARVAGYFGETLGQIYTLAGKPKAGSELEKAETEAARAAEQLRTATERVERLEEATKDFEDASGEIEAITRSLISLRNEQGEFETRVQKLADLRQQEATQIADARSATQHYENLKLTHRRILELESGMEQLALDLAPRGAEIAQLEKSAGTAKQSLQAADADYRTASEALRKARLGHDLAVAHSRLFDQAERLERVDEKQVKVTNLRSSLSALEMQLAQVPKVDPAKLRKLQRLEKECWEARAALQAMAAGVEVLASDRPVFAGGEPLAAGQKSILTEDTELHIGDSIRLRIMPGGGTSLAEARKTELDSQNGLQEALDAVGLKSVQEAVEARGVREGLEVHIGNVRGELDGMDAEALQGECTEAQNELAAANADVERLTALVPGLNAPVDKVAARNLASDLRQGLAGADRVCSDAESARNQWATALERAEEALNNKRAALAQEQLRLNGLNAQRDLLVTTHGDGAARTQALIEADSARISTAQRLKATTDAIAALQPEMVEADRERIRRAIRAKENEDKSARERIAGARAILSIDGGEDPRAARATAEARARSANDYRDRVRRNAQAIALLDSLFQEEQRALSEQFTRPLAEKIAGYLQCIFGAGARALVKLEDGEFTTLQLSRPGPAGGPFAFDTLSGGAKEQTAAAVRLAMAEVLAADYGGCLPVVFDDAFAYSDPERVRQLQRMLDLAAARGLQLIILTCNPVDYAALGAQHTVLSRRQTATAGQQTMDAGTSTQAADALAARERGPEGAAPGPTGGLEAGVTAEQRDQLLARLSDLGGSAGNLTLRESLGWDETTYAGVKADLVAAGRLVPGRGRGGSVSLPGA